MPKKRARHRRGDAMNGPKSLERNSEWFSKQNLSDFIGQWVCVVDQKVVATSPDLAELVRRIEGKTAGKTPFVFHVPDGLLTV